MSNPEQGPQEQGVIGSWQTVSFQAPDFLEPVRDGADTVFGFLTNTLSVLSGILEVAKVFATGLLDPQIAIIEGLISLIKNLLNDLRQAGIYIHGDFYSFEGPTFDGIRGGFGAYESRMVSRLLDTSDPNRPDFSKNTTLLSIFLYGEANDRGVQNLVRLVQNILKLFNREVPIPRLQNQAYNIQSTYGYDGATIFSFSKSFFQGFSPTINGNALNPYNAVNLTWEMAPLPGPKFPGAPVVPPTGFLVEFSTNEEPLPLFFDRPISGTLEEMTLTNEPPKRDVGQFLDEEGNPVFLTSGADQISLSSGLDFNDALTVSGNLKPDAVRVFTGKTISDVAPIQIGDLKDGGKYFLQRGFFVSAAQGAFFSGKKYGATFTFDEMPWFAEWKLNNGKVIRKNERQVEKLFVRVRAVSAVVNSPSDVQWVVDQSVLRDRNGVAPKVPVSSGFELNDRGPSSEVVPVVFPEASTNTWLRLVAESLAILVLSRSDLPVLSGKSGELDFPPKIGDQLLNGVVPTQWGQFRGNARRTTGLEILASFLLPRVIGEGQSSKYFEQTLDPNSFRRSLFVSCINYTNRLFTRHTPSLETRQYVISQSPELENLRFSFSEEGVEVGTTLNSPGLSVLELLTNTSVTSGVSLNSGSLGIVGERESDLALFSSVGENLVRSPHFFSFSRGGLTVGSVDSSPVLYSRRGNSISHISFFRNEISDEVYRQVALVLGMAAGPQVRPQEKGWISFRLFPQGLPDIDRTLDQILALLESLQGSIESAAETVRRAIEMIQSRIAELQAFLNAINANIQRFLRMFLEISPANGLILVSGGTEGVVQGLVSASNKPETGEISLNSFGAGVVIVAGGLPTFVLEIFQNLFQGS